MATNRKHPDRLERHSGTGRLGLPRKQGSGKGSWGKVLDYKTSPSALDENDPNYDSEEEQEQKIFKSFGKLLENTSLFNILDHQKKQKIVTVPASSTVEKVLQILTEHNILSAPVRDEPSGDWIGIIDMLDILRALLECGAERVEEAASKKIDVSKLGPFRCVSNNAKLPEVLLLLKSNILRAVVVDEANNAVDIVSQSNLIQFLAREINYYSDVAQATVESVGLGIHASVASVSSEARAIDAFTQLLASGLNALAITDSNDTKKLVASISVSDLRGLHLKNFKDINLPVLEYLKKNCPSNKMPPESATLQTTIETVVLKLAATKKHRLWLVDECKTILGVITLTDVINLLDLRAYIYENEEPSMN